MAGLFSLAARKASQMAEGKPDPITIDAGPFKVKIPMADGGLSSIQKNISIKGQPHELSYITPSEGDLLKDLGGSGRMVNGIPAYAMGDPDAPDDSEQADDSYYAGGLGWNNPDDPNLMMLEDPTLIGEQLRKLEQMREAEEEEEKAKERNWAQTVYERMMDSLIDDPKKSSLDNTVIDSLVKGYHEDRAKAGVEYSKEGVDFEVSPEQERYKFGSDLLESVQKAINLYQIPGGPDYKYANRLEDTGLKTHGKGLRGDFEYSTPSAVTREEYDPEKYNLMDITSPKGAARLEYEQIAKENPHLTASELLSKFNANDPSLKRYSTTTLSPRDLAHLGLTGGAAIGPQQTYLDSSRFRGLLQGLGLIGQGIAFGPIAPAARMFNEGKGLTSSLLDIVEKEFGVKTPYRETVSDIYDRIPSLHSLIERGGRGLGSLFVKDYMGRYFNPYTNEPLYERETGGKVTPLPPIIDPPIPIPIPPDPEPEPEDTRTPMQKYYNIDPEEDEWYKDEDRKPMEEYYKDFPLDVNPNYTANQLRILAYSYPELFGNYKPPPKPPKDPEPPIDLQPIPDDVEGYNPVTGRPTMYRRSRGIM
jgi:hypothetical protein